MWIYLKRSNLKWQMGSNLVGVCVFKQDSCFHFAFYRICPLASLVLEWCFIVFSSDVIRYKPFKCLLPKFWYFYMQICNAVAVAKIMNSTLILPVLKQDQIWKDQTWDIYLCCYTFKFYNDVCTECIYTEYIKRAVYWLCLSFLLH